MADVKVSGLPNDPTVDGGHYVVLNDPTGPSTKRGFLSTLAAWFFDQINIPDGSGSPRTRDSEMLFDFVASGLVWTGDAYASTRNASMTSGVVYINGRRISISSVTARSFTASKDTYIDILDNADGTGTLVYTEVTNNAASPALAANSVRVGIIVTGASNIASVASINQGQETKLLPIASSLAYKITDSLGNLICPRDPTRKLLGYRIMTANQGSITAEAVVTELNVPIKVPTGRKVKLTLAGTKSNTSSSTDTVRIRETNISGTTVASRVSFTAAATASEDMGLAVVITPSATTINYVVTLAVASGTLTANAGACLIIELE